MQQLVTQGPSWPNVLTIQGQCVDIVGQCVDIMGQCVDIMGQRVDIMGQRVDIVGQHIDKSWNTHDTESSSTVHMLL